MTPIDETTQGASAEHPDKLLWYVSGKLAADERRHVESHLFVCAECRSTARALESLKPGAERFGTPVHPTPEELDAFRQSSPGSRSVERARIEAHLNSCAACSEDLAALRQMSDRVPAIGFPWRRRAVAAGFALLLAGPAIWFWLAGREPTITLMPSLRSPAAGAVLKGHGPWSVQLVPPSESGTGSYEMQVERPDGSVVASLPSFELAASQQAIEIEIPVLPSPGSYRLGLKRAGPDGARVVLYPFRVEAGPGD